MQYRQGWPHCLTRPVEQEVSNDERGLTDAAPQQDERDGFLADQEPNVDPDDIDITEETDPDKVDLHKVATGVRPVTATVRLFLDDGTELRRIAEQIDSCPSDDDVPDELVQQWFDAKDRFDNGEEFVVEARGREWLDHFSLRMREQIDLPEDATEADLLAVSHLIDAAQLAAQIVSHDVTPEWIAQVREGVPSEFAKLYKAAKAVNTQPAKVLMPDFSQRVCGLTRPG